MSALSGRLPAVLALVQIIGLPGALDDDFAAENFYAQIDGTLAILAGGGVDRRQGQEGKARQEQEE